MTCNCTPEGHRSRWSRENDWEWEGAENEECWNDHEWDCPECAASGSEAIGSACGCCSEQATCTACGGTGLKA